MDQSFIEESCGTDGAILVNGQNPHVDFRRDFLEERSQRYGAEFLVFVGADSPRILLCFLHALAI